MDAGKERKGKIGLCLFFFLTWERYKCQGKKEKKKKKNACGKREKIPSCLDNVVLSSLPKE